MWIVARRWLVTVLWIAVATAIAALLLRFWASAVVTGVSYISDHTPTESEIIKDMWPVRIVQPAWLSAGPGSLLTRWMYAEEEAREIAVILLWFTLVTIAGFRHARQERTQT